MKSLFWVLSAMILSFSCDRPIGADQKMADREMKTDTISCPPGNKLDTTAIAQ